MDRVLTFEEILAAPDSKIEAVAVPEWGGTVHVRMMSGTERDAFERDMLAARDTQPGNMPDNFRARFLARTLCTSSGEPLPGLTAEALGKKSGAVLDRLFQEAQRLNALDPKAGERLGNG